MSSNHVIFFFLLRAGRSIVLNAWFKWDSCSANSGGEGLKRRKKKQMIGLLRLKNNNLKEMRCEWVRRRRRLYMWGVFAAPG